MNPGAMGVWLTGLLLGLLIGAAIVLFLGLVVAPIIRGRVAVKHRQAIGDTEILAAYHAVWKVREGARQKLTQSLAPVAYWEMIDVGLDVVRR